MSETPFTDAAAWCTKSATIKIEDARVIEKRMNDAYAELAVANAREAALRAEHHQMMNQYIEEVHDLVIKRDELMAQLRGLVSSQHAVYAVVAHCGSLSYKACLEPVGVYSASNKPLFPPDWLGKPVRVTLA